MMEIVCRCLNHIIHPYLDFYVNIVLHTFSLKSNLNKVT
jgi:hypothetical protein